MTQTTQFNKIIWNSKIPWLLGVEIQRQVDGGAFEVISIADPRPSEYLDYGVELGKTYTYRVKYNAKNFSLMSNEVTKALPDSLKIVKGKIKRFTPIYWLARASTGTFVAVTSPTDTSIKISASAYSAGSKAQIVWETTDTRDHASLAYDSVTSYSNTTLKFKLALPKTLPDLNNETGGAVIGIRYQNGSPTSIVHLKNYARLESSNDDVSIYNVELDFGNLKAGYNSDQTVSPTGISEVVLSFSLDGSDNDPENLDGSKNFFEVSQFFEVQLDSISITGSNSDLGVNLPVVLKNSFSIATDYDSDWDLNPKRIAKNIASLGYVSGIYHTVGVQRYPELVPVDGVLKVSPIVILGQRVLNLPCKVWHDGFCKAMKDSNQLPTFMVPIEVSQDIGIDGWLQRDANGLAGQGFNRAPTYLNSLTNGDFLKFMKNAFSELSEFLYNSGLPIRLAVDNPRWAISLKKNLSGFDDSTREEFSTSTGMNPPIILNVFDSAKTTDPTELRYISFLAESIVKFLSSIKSTLLQKYITSQLGTVLSVSDIYTARPSIMEKVNLTDSLKSPTLDFLGVKCDQEMWDHTPSLANILTDTDKLFKRLAYMKSKTFYMSSFVPDANTASNFNFIPDSPYPTEVWKRIMGDFKLHFGGVTDRFVLRNYEQIMKTSLTYTTNDSFGYFLQGKYYEPYTDDRSYPDTVMRSL